MWLRELSVGDWFKAEGEAFEIVGIDIKAEIVLLQYYDGAVDEVDFDAWLELNAYPSPPPGDLRGALDADRADLSFEEGGRNADAMDWIESHGL